MTENSKINLWNVALLDASQQSPFDFMREQGEILKEQTNGLLWGEVKDFTSEDEITYHEFRIASQRLKDYRCLLLQTAHAKHVFPLYIYDFSQSDDALKSYQYVSLAESISKTLQIQTLPVKSRDGKYFATAPNFTANDFNEFQIAFTTILKSKGTRAIVQSLILQSRRPAVF